MVAKSLPHSYPKHVGALLKAAREEKALDRSEIALKIALSPAQLRLLEEGAADHFYNMSFYLQALRRYSDFLSVSLPEPSADESSEPEMSTPEPEIAAPPAAPLHPRHKRLRSLSLAGVAAIAAAIFVVWQPNGAAPPENSALSVNASDPVKIDSAARNPTTQAVAQGPPSSPTSGERTPAAAVDSTLVNSESTWVQIVAKDGSKTNLRPSAGEPVEFDAQSTAAIVFGRPATASLTVRGNGVEIKNFLVLDASPPRALVILRDL
jgi:transcriptional regulator with XRE-family HTH domain